MKYFIRCLLFLIVQILAANSFAGVGGIGGGTNSSAKFVYVKVCDGGEAGDQCRVVGLNSAYYDQNGNLKQSAMTGVSSPCIVYEVEGFPVPCKPDHEYGVPKWLQQINEFFGNQGQSPTITDEE